MVGNSSRPTGERIGAGMFALGAPVVNSFMGPAGFGLTAFGTGFNALGGMPGSPEEMANNARYDNGVLTYDIPGQVVNDPYSPDPPSGVGHTNVGTQTANALNAIGAKLPGAMISTPTGNVYADSLAAQKGATTPSWMESRLGIDYHQQALDNLMFNAQSRAEGLAGDLATFDHPDEDDLNDVDMYGPEPGALANEALSGVGEAASASAARGGAGPTDAWGNAVGSQDAAQAAAWDAQGYDAAAMAAMTDAQAMAAGTPVSQEDYDAGAASDGGDGCFLTTAAVELLGKDDDCVELETFRRVRDELLDGPMRWLVKRYYRQAPAKAEALKSHPRGRAIAEEMFQSYVPEVMAALEEGSTARATAIYMKMSHYVSEELDK